MSRQEFPATTLNSSRVECPNVAVNLVDCPCTSIQPETHQPCPRKGKCCECVRNHRGPGARNPLPACFRNNFVFVKKEPEDRH